MNKMMTFDPQKRITPVQALKHPYFDGCSLANINMGAAPSVAGLQGANSSQGKNFFNAANDF